jgi:hypothetical protein
MESNPVDLYKHYKGGIYKILHYGTHTETGERMVVYKQPNGASIWVRPASMFFENVLVDGISQPRFKLIVDDSTI